MDEETEETKEATTSDFLNHDNDHESETDLNKQESTGYYVPQNHSNDNNEPTTTFNVDPHFTKDTWVNDKNLSKSDSAILKIVLKKDAKYTCADIKSAIKDFKGGF